MAMCIEFAGGLTNSEGRVEIRVRGGQTPAIRVGTKTPLTRTTESAEAAEFAEEGTQANARAAGHRNVLTLNERSALPTACVYRSMVSAVSAVRAAMPWVRCGVPDKWGVGKVPRQGAVIFGGRPAAIFIWMRTPGPFYAKMGQRALCSSGACFA